MAEQTPQATTPRTAGQRAGAWIVLDGLYRHDPMDPLIAGARAAAEWTEGETPVAPVTNRRTPPILGAVRWESHAANMRALGIGAEPAPAPVQAFRAAYARGAAEWMFWWTGLEDLPSWLIRRRPVDPLAS
jgi:hypothetical protein